MAVSRQPKPEPTAAPTTGEERKTTMEMVYIWYHDDTFVKVNTSMPRLLFNFAAAHDGKEAPETPEEGMWLVWHALGRPDESLDAWIDSIKHFERVAVELVGKERS